MKNKIINALLNKKSVALSDKIDIEYLPSIRTTTQDRIESCRIYYKNTCILTYVYLQDVCPSYSCKTITWKITDFTESEQNEIKNILAIFYIYIRD